MADPFDLTQYVTSFKKVSDYTPQTFQFADFDAIFSQLAEAIRMRQAGVSIGFNIPENSFLNVESYDTTTPFSLSDSIDRFQDAVRELVTGDLVEEFGKLPTCNVYIGFFIHDDGLPIIGVTDIAPNGLDFTEAPDPNDFPNLVDFAKEIARRINEIISALNVLTFLHANMSFRYEFDMDCTPGISPPPPPPPPVSPPPPPPVSPPPPPPVSPPPPPPVSPPPPPPISPPPPPPPISPPPPPPVPPPPGTCFGYGTLISMAAGPDKLIEEVVIGDMVVGYYIPDVPPEDKEKSYLKWSALSLKHCYFFPAQVQAIIAGEEKSYYIINGKTKVTFEHPFLVKTKNNEWQFIRAENLKVGHIACFYGKRKGEKIKSIKLVNETIKTVNFSVAGVNSFIANGFVVHNIDDNTTGDTIFTTKTILGGGGDNVGGGSPNL